MELVSCIYFLFPLVKRNGTHFLPDHLKDFILESFEMSKESNTSQKLSCSISSTRRITLVENLVNSYGRGQEKDGAVIII
jgi:hypothetical protein